MKISVLFDVALFSENTEQTENKPSTHRPKTGKLGSLSIIPDCSSKFNIYITAV